MKTCSKCKEFKDLSDFAFKSKAKGTYQSWCKSCQKIYAKADYQSKPEYYKDKSAVSNTEIRTRNKNFIIAYLQEHPCVGCGNNDIEVLQFDHEEMVRGRGKRISNFLTSSLEALQIEIDKCKVRCANCHVRRTRAQMGWERTI